jgi:hypothetical protein
LEIIMQQTYTNHANVRSQQRGIPPLVSEWLLDFGDEVYDGHGGVVRYFTSKSVRKVEKAVGREPVRRMSEFMRCYLVQSSYDGTVLTVGKRHNNKHLPRH